MPNRFSKHAHSRLAPAKRFELWRSPIGGGSPQARDCSRRIVEAHSVPELIAKAEAFGAEATQPSRIFLRCLSKRRFPNTPWSLRCDGNMRQGGRQR
jgi:hypothetical protein